MTSLRSHILAEDASFHMRYCLLTWDENPETPYLSAGHFDPPPASLTKSPHRLGLIETLEY